MARLQGVRESLDTGWAARLEGPRELLDTRYSPTSLSPPEEERAPPFPGDPLFGQLPPLGHGDVYCEIFALGPGCQQDIRRAHGGRYAPLWQGCFQCVAVP